MTQIWKFQSTYSLKKEKKKTQPKIIKQRGQCKTNDDLITTSENIALFFLKKEDIDSTVTCDIFKNFAYD